MRPRTSSGTPHTAPSSPHWATSVPHGPTKRTYEAPWSRYQNRHVLIAEIGEPDPTWIADPNAQIDELRDQLTTATHKVRATCRNPPCGPNSLAGSSRNTPTGLSTAFQDWSVPALEK